MKKILLIIAAGGSEQLEAAAGALLALEENGAFDGAELHYRASSGGAPVAALHAAGMGAKAICELIRSMLFDRLCSREPASIVYSLEGAYKILCDNLPEKPISRCQVAVFDNERCRGRMVLATPITALASMSFPGLTVTHYINGIEHCDGGIVNMIPTCSIAEIPAFDHIYMLLAPYDPAPAQSHLPKALQWALCTRDAEEHQILNEDRWGDLDNVTILRPELPYALRKRSYLTRIFSWSEDYCMLDSAYLHAKGVLA